MDNRPGGRQKTVSGTAKKVGTHGSGFGGGPVGRGDGYSGRTGGGSYRSGGSGPTRGGGGKLLPIIIAIAVMLLGGGGLSMSGLLGSLFGGGTTTVTENGGSSIGGSLLDAFMPQLSGSSVSSGWVSSPSTKLNTSVAAGAREKYTRIKGDGSDVYTIMVYMCGTDLESKHGMATSDLQEMLNARLGSKVNLLVYTGGCTNWKKFSISNRVNQIYKVDGKGLTCLVKDDGTAAMTKPDTLTRFIKYCKQNYKADRYALIFWDHGGGSISGYGYDERNASAGSMTLKGIDQALKAADTKFDFIGFDACLMATLENALMLDNYADYMIASEETEPGVGWYYTNWLTALSADTGMSTVELGQKIVDDFVETCDSRCPGQKTPLSVVDLAELSYTVPDKLRDFASGTSRLMQSGDYQTVSDARSGAREFSSNKIDQVDLCHLAYNLGTDESKALASTLREAVKYNRTCSSISNAYGISVYFPYRKTSTVDSAVATYAAIGVDDAYSRCIQQFASMEAGGQAASGSSGSPLGSLLGSLGGSSSGIDVGSILGGLLSGGSGSFGKSLADIPNAEEYITAHRLTDSDLKWTQQNGRTVLHLSEEQWKLVQDLQINVFLKEGDHFIDLGLDLYDSDDLDKYGKPRLFELLIKALNA